MSQDDLQHPTTPVQLLDKPSLSHNPEESSPAQHDSVSTGFSAETGRRTTRGIVIIAVILLLCLAIVSFERFHQARDLIQAAEKSYAQPPQVDVVIAKAATVGQRLMLPGETAAWFETTIYARVNGYVESWQVDIGDKVQKGQVLATIETPELDAEFAASKAQLKASQAQVDERKAEAEFSKTTNERWRDSPKGAVSEQERESKKADYESAQARLYAANARVFLDQAKVDQYTALTEFRQVKAPFDGIITERKIDIGNLVTAGSGTTTTPLYRMAKTDPLRIFVDVPQSVSGDLMNAGVPAEIHANGVAGASFSGKIARSSESLNSQARTMRVEVDVPNTRHLLVPGMYVNVTFQLPIRGTVEVPAAVLIFRSSGVQVAKVNSDGKIQFNDVTIARDNGTEVELASGASPGDHLVLNISSQIASGQTVNANGAGSDGAAKPLPEQP